ncbi:ATP-binding protein [Streptomyces sp. NPDC047860]|uniref:ATP-binding protein n=1 Tax=Streptomyces sp. NPDC047860 TaxID=3155743 RepID=UPI00341009C0
MTKVVRQPPGKVRPRNAPMASLPIRRAGTRVRWALLSRWHTLMIRREARRGVTRPKNWRRWSSYTTATRVGCVLVVLVVLAWCGEGLWIVITGETTGFEEWRKGNAGFDTLIRFVGPVLTVGIVTALFLFLWYAWTKRRYMKKARKNSAELVPTAGPHMGEIVGRQEIAQVIAQRLRERSTRRPYLLVGGVGVGKTAVLVRLTEILAKLGAVPVPVRLRDATGQPDLNFEQMARKRFSDEAPQGILARSKNERVWQQLLADDKPVVIADGLEEAILDEQLQDDRDNIIRRAIRRAYEEKLPLVIASRPHTPLEGTHAAIIDLEPLSEEAALRFVGSHAPETDERRLDWIVETAEVTESPIYLQIARELQRHDALERDRARNDAKRLDTRSEDRSTLRLWLLDTWYHALVEGRLHDEVPLCPQERCETLEVVSSLACIGLLQDKLEVGFADLLGKHGPPSQRLRAVTRVLRIRIKQHGKDQNDTPGNGLSEKRREQIWTMLLDRLSGEENRLPLEGNLSQRHAALASFTGNADLLRLVEGSEKKVRFPHSIMQAYLGFRVIRELGEHDVGELIDFVVQSLRPPGPSRELLVALVLFSRARAARPAEERSGIIADRNQGARKLGDPRQQAPASIRSLAGLLYKAAENRTDPKALDLYAAALEIESVERMPGLLKAIADKLEERWRRMKGDRRTLDEAKLKLVKQFGAALRMADEKIDTTPLYHKLLKLGVKDDSYSIRLAVAQEVGGGGDAAFGVIRKWIPRVDCDPMEEYRDKVKKLRDKKSDGYEKCAAKMDKAAPTRGTSPTVSKEIDRINHERQHISQDYRKERIDLWREFVMRAWMVPMLLGSVSEGHRDEAQQRLMRWLRHLDPRWLRRNAPKGAPDLPLSLENALAQGFKYAANRRRRHPHTYPGGRTYLIRHAETMLQQTRCWYAQLSLLHALCLWELPDSITRSEHRGEDVAPVWDGQGDFRELSKGYRGTTAVQSVERWLSMAGTDQATPQHTTGNSTVPRQRLHPFVAEAGDLVALALETRRPERYLWIDEMGVVANIGSRTGGPQHYRKHGLWIPPSVGWGTLDGRAQRLVADVLVMLNLIERDGHPDEVEDRLDRCSRVEQAPDSPLPPCITTDRAPLHSELTVGTLAPPAPGDTCLPTCRFQFCPYPPRGTQSRAEILEPFCRQQQAMLPGRFRRNLPRLFRRKTPYWVGMRVRELDQFWDAMANRTRSQGSRHGPSPRSE